MFPKLFSYLNVYPSTFSLLSCNINVYINQRLKGSLTSTLKPIRIKSLSHKEKPSPSISSLGRGKRFVDRTKVSEHIDENNFDYFENRAHAISQYKSNFDLHQANEKFHKEAKRKLYYARAKTIERKYFKKPDPPNLLTWLAKEQIRFLHENYPEEWTVQRLADSFPVNKECIKKVLTSRLRLHRNEDIIQHDLEVHKNWTDLKAALENGEVDDEIYRNLKSAVNESLISNASGISHLPFPPVKKKSTKIGPFSLIVKDCLEKKEKPLNEKVNLDEKLSRLSAVLSDVSNLFDSSRKSKSSGNSQIQHVFSQATINDPDHENFSKSNKKKVLKSEDKEFLKHNEMQLSPDKLKKLKNSSTNVKYYILGNSVYDENGEFLYKKP